MGHYRRTARGVGPDLLVVGRQQGYLTVLWDVYELLVVVRTKSEPRISERLDAYHLDPQYPDWLLHQRSEVASLMEPRSPCRAAKT